MAKLVRRGNGDLSRSTRPRRLSEVYGNHQVLNALRSLLVKDVPQRTIMFSGDNGTGKTTLARIMACSISCDSPLEVGEPCLECPSCRAILANEPGMTTYGMSEEEIENMVKANTRGLDKAAIDKARASILESLQAQRGFIYYEEVSGSDISKEAAAAIANQLTMRSMYNNKPRIVVIDEAQEMSTAAMRYLLKPVEDLRSNVWVFICTSDPRKMPKALRQRFLQLETSPLHVDEIRSMIEDVADLAKLDLKDPVEELALKFQVRGITAPREIIQTVEALSDGFTEVSVDDQKSKDFYNIAKLLIDSKFDRDAKLKLLKPLLDELTPKDAVPVQLMITNFMKTVSLNSGNRKALKILGVFLSADAKLSVNPVATIIFLTLMSLDL